jgi:hypothetical protein
VHVADHPESDHELLIIDTGTDQVVKSIQLTGLRNQCAVTPDGKYVGVPIRGGDSVDILSTVCHAIASSGDRAFFPSPNPLVFSPAIVNRPMPR